MQQSWEKLLEKLEIDTNLLSKTASNWTRKRSVEETVNIFFSAPGQDFSTQFKNIFKDWPEDATHYRKLYSIFHAEVKARIDSQHPRVKAIRRLRATAEAPSGATSAIMKRNAEQQFAIGRPYRAAVSLGFVFEGFFQLFQALQDANPFHSFDSELFRNSAQLVAEMNKFYSDEAQRQNQIVPLLNKCLEQEISIHPSDARISNQDSMIRGRTPCMDGVVRVKSSPIETLDRLSPATLILEVKAELGMGGGCPLIESMEYYKALLLKLPSNVIAHSACPVIQITIAGPYLQVSLLAVTASSCGKEDVPCGEPITDLLCCMGKENQMDFIYKLVKLFYGVRKCLANLETYYSTILEKAENQIPRHCTSHYIDLEIFSQWLNFILPEPLCANKTVFKALSNDDYEELDDPVSYVLKFTWSYNEDVHKCLASKGLAPNCVCVLTTGVSYAIVMHESSKEQGFLQLSDLPNDDRGKDDCLFIKTKCEEALKHLETNQFVHGDLRPPNILVNPSLQEVHIIDFEWSGKQGSVRYPVNINNDLDYPGEGGDLITFNHDQQMMDQFLRILFSSV